VNIQCDSYYTAIWSFKRAPLFDFSWRRYSSVLAVQNFTLANQGAYECQGKTLQNYTFYAVVELKLICMLSIVITTK